MPDATFLQHVTSTRSPRCQRAEFGLLQKLFNDECASTRVLIEHTFGMLKNRWSCLRGLRISIEDKDDEGRATCWIRACVVLHNLLIETADVFLDDNRDYPAGDAAKPDLARAEQDPLTHPTPLRVMTEMGYSPTFRSAGAQRASWDC